MQITSAKDEAKRRVLSAFPRHKRPFSEPISATEDDTIGSGLTLPELIRRYYPGAIPWAISGQFGFLSRDNKEREYSPGKEDPFVFKDWGSVEVFKKEAKRLLAMLTKEWRDLGWRTKIDKDRGVEVPDTEHVWEALDPNHPDHKLLMTTYPAVVFIASNADIMKKSCVVRGVSAGWWCVSYKGKKTANKEYFRTSLNAHKRAFKALSQTDTFRSIREKLWREASDPIDTNPGYPYFNGNLDAEGSPVTRIRTVHLFHDIGKIRDWDKMLQIVDDLGASTGLKGHPFAIAPLRRLSAGYKWNHQFTITPTGMRTAYDERGENSQRVAWMVPYVYNVLLTPLHTVMKAVRMMMPGLYHDSDIRRERLKIIRESTKRGQLLMAEADYSNYDRYIPVDIIEEVVDGFADLTSEPVYWKAATMYLHTKASLIWPDYSAIERSGGSGWAFKPGLLGVLSGVKWTSEAGTFVNSVVNGEALARTLGWNEDQLFEYLTMYKAGRVGSKYEYYYIASDDTQLINKSPKLLKKQGDEFVKATKAAGLKGTLELGDRFLMREMLGGDDRPVPARVWQNTLSNETPPESELIFLAGLAARTDGMLGLKTVDPLGTGTVQHITRTEARFSLEVIKSLRSFITSAANPSKLGASFLSEMLDVEKSFGTQLQGSGYGRIQASPGVGLQMNKWRHQVTKMLAESELEKASLKALKGNVNAAWLYQLLKDRHIPSSALILDQILALAPQVNATILKLMGMEQAFFKFASSTIGVRDISLKST